MFPCCEKNGLHRLGFYFKTIYINELKTLFNYALTVKSLPSKYFCFTITFYNA